MNYSEILKEFRMLGGIANNIELREGIHGNGIYPEDPKKAIEIAIPPHLLISLNLLKLDRYNQVKVIEKTAIAPKIIDFYEKYQQFFG